jgi:NAD+ kinase
MDLGIVDEEKIALMTTGQQGSIQVSEADTVGKVAGFRRVGVLYHPHKPQSHKLAEEIARDLRQRDVDSWLGLSRDDKTIRGQIADLDLLIVLGGDGSMLRAARIGAGHNTPVLGINMGRIGFLSEMTPDNWQERLPRVFDGNYWLEERMMLKAESRRDDEVLGRHLALNDVVVSRGSLARVVHLETHIDGDYLTTYVADGLIVSTPTGSTAYSLAVGGPILPPELHNIVVIPIAPHLSLDRAIVLAEGSTITMRVSTDHQAILTVDGQFEFDLQDGDLVEVYTSEHISQFVRLGKRSDFYRTLLARLEPNPVHKVE